MIPTKEFHRQIWHKKPRKGLEEISRMIIKQKSEKSGKNLLLNEKKITDEPEIKQTKIIQR